MDKILINNIDNVIQLLGDAMVFQRHWNAAEPATPMDYDFKGAIENAKSIKIKLLEDALKQFEKQSNNYQR